MPRLRINFNENRNGSPSIVISEATKLQEVDASLEEYSSQPLSKMTYTYFILHYILDTKIS